MKRLNNFLSTTTKFKLFLFSYVLLTLIIFLMFFFLSVPQAKITFYISLKIALLSGLPFSLIFYTLILSDRKSDEFWKYSHVVEELVENANTKIELQSIYENELKKLHSLAMGQPHYYKTKEINSIINVKYKLVQ